jgi:hypothetical protein
MPPETKTTRIDIAQYLMREYGVLLSVKEVAEVLRYPNAEAARRAHYRGKLPVKLKKFPDRRVLFATASDVAKAIGQLEGLDVTEEDTT